MMDIRDRRALKSAAARALSTAEYDPKKLVLLHSGAILLLSLLLTVADYFLEKAISGTGGLNGIGTRSILSTVQTCLRIAPMAVLPFWQIGYTSVTMAIARREQTQPAALAVSFQRFLPVLRLLLLQGALYFVIAMVSSYLGSFLFMLTPWAQPMLDAAAQIMYDGGNMEALDAVMETVITDSAVPLMVCYLIVFLVLAAPFFYRFRMADFVLLDNPDTGAFAALRTSRSMMKGNALTLLKLDLSFWWFYGLDVLVSVIGYADMLLSLAGVSLPISADAAFFTSFGVYLVCQLALYRWRKNEVSTTYAVFYDALKEPQPQPQPLPRNLPWIY